MPRKITEGGHQAQVVFANLHPAKISAVHYTVKKVIGFSRPQQGCHLPNSPWPGILKLFSARESLVSDIPAGDGKTGNLFYSVIYFGRLKLVVNKQNKNTCVSLFDN